MPHLLHFKTYLDTEIRWTDVWPREEWPQGYTALGKSHGQAPTLEGPIPYQMTGGKLPSGGALPDFMPGRMSGDMIVSAKVRDVINELDRVSHHFVPLELTLKDGSVVNTHSLFIAGDLVDGIIAEKSEVTPQIFGGVLGYYNSPATPHIVWDARAIEGRAIWVDRYLKHEFAISDDLKNAFEAHSFTPFNTTESPSVSAND